MQHFAAWLDCFFRSLKTTCPANLHLKIEHLSYRGVNRMASFNDPKFTFAPIEVIDRLLEIRSELGFAETLYLDRSNELTDILDAYGFDVYAFSTQNDKIDLNLPSTPVVPGGDTLHSSATGH